MSNPVTPPTTKPAGSETASSGTPPNPLTWYGVLLLGLYLMFLVILLSYMLYKLWPPQRRSTEQNRARASQAARSGRGGRTAPGNGNAGSRINNTNTSAGNLNASNNNTGIAANTNAGAGDRANNSSGRPAAAKTSADADEGTNASTADANQNNENSDQESATDQPLPPVTLFGFLGKRFTVTLEHTVEVRLLLIVLLTGALGSYIHAATSFIDYAGNRKLSASWVWWYLLRPFVGMALALVFYFVVRGGFISPQAGGGDMNVFGLAALAGLVGMFSKQATDKLNEVFSTLFRSAPGEGDDKRGDPLGAKTKNPVPSVTAIKPTSYSQSKPEDIVVTGSNFTQSSEIHLNASVYKNVYKNSTTLSFRPLPADVANPGDLQLTVVNPPPGGGTSEAKTVHIVA